MPTKKPKATAPFQVQASLAGPCYPDYGGTVDTSYRHVVLELAIRQTENDFLSERVEFRLEGFSSRRSDGAWSEPLMHGLHFSPSFQVVNADWTSADSCRHPDSATRRKIGRPKFG